MNWWVWSLFRGGGLNQAAFKGKEKGGIPWQIWNIDSTRVTHRILVWCICFMLLCFCWQPGMHGIIFSVFIWYNKIQTLILVPLLRRVWDEMRWARTVKCFWFTYRWLYLIFVGSNLIQVKLGWKLSFLWCLATMAYCQEANRGGNPKSIGPKMTRNWLNVTWRFYMILLYYVTHSNDLYRCFVQGN